MKICVLEWNNSSKEQHSQTLVRTILVDPAAHFHLYTNERIVCQIVLQEMEILFTSWRSFFAGYSFSSFMISCTRSLRRSRTTPPTRVFLQRGKGLWSPPQRIQILPQHDMIQNAPRQSTAIAKRNVIFPPLLLQRKLNYFLQRDDRPNDRHHPVQSSYILRYAHISCYFFPAAGPKFLGTPPPPFYFYDLLH